MATFIYNPDRKSKAQLIAEFVVRKKVFASIFKDLETGAMQQPEQHYLLVGQRGTGKTTLLTRLKYAVEDSPQLNKWLLPVMFAEEQYNITELANLWENIAQYLDDYAGFDNVYGEMEANLGKKDYEAICFDILAKHLDAQQKKIVLLIDNIGDLLKKFDELEVRRLREILQTKPHIRLIAASPFLLDSIIDYHQPLLEFFKVVRLEGLSKPETEELLLALGEVFGEQEKIAAIIKETPQRIEVMRTLSGGIPRTIALLFKVFVDDAHGTALTDLEKLLDAVTPLYKHRMDDLKPQQQKIMDAVARHWDAISVSELKKRVRMEGKIVSAQLNQLVQNQVIDKVPTNTKNHLYLLKERFFNIWYLMRYGRKDDKQRVVWLVKFLENWCSPEDLTKRIMDYTQKMQNGSLSEHYQEFYGNVYASMKNMSPHLKYELKKYSPNKVSKQINLDDTDMISIASDMLEKDMYKEAIEVLAGMSELSMQSQEILRRSIEGIFESKDSESYFEIFKKYVEVELNSNGYSSNLIHKGNSSDDFFLCLVIDYLRSFLSYTIDKKDDQTSDKLIENLISLINSEQSKIMTELFVLYNISWIISRLLFYKRKNTAFKFFTEIKAINLKEVIKPLYFATLYYTKGRDSKEFLAIGGEIKDVVEGFIKIIEDGQKLNSK